MAQLNDWQDNCPSIRDRGKYLLDMEKWTDCRFLVGKVPNQKLLSGHKLILAMASPVFERMFFGNFPQNTDTIVISDIQPDVFHAMLEYIYADKINISSFDIALELCYAAKKYLLPHIVAECTKYLAVSDNLSPNNACRVYESAKLFDELRLMQRSMEIIAAKTKEVLADPNFCDIQMTTFLTILDCEELNIDTELDLFNALSRYAIKRGYIPDNDDNNNASDKKSSQSQDHQPKREPRFRMDSQQKTINENLMKQAVKKIRFLTLTPKQFAEGPARSKLLQQTEAYSILLQISSSCIDDCPMPDGFCTSRIQRNKKFRQIPKGYILHESGKYCVRITRNGRNNFV